MERASAKYVPKVGTLATTSNQMKVGMSATEAALAARAGSLMAETAAATSSA